MGAEKTETRGVGSVVTEVTLNPLIRGTCDRFCRHRFTFYVLRFTSSTQHQKAKDCPNNEHAR
jgi:hypothetical protein